MERSPFRPAALRRYATPDVRPTPRLPATAPPAWLWLVAAALAGLVARVGSTELPSYAHGVAVVAPGAQVVVLLPARDRARLAVGQPVLLDGAPGTTIAAVEPDVLAPSAAAARFGLDPADLPAPVAVALAPPPPGLEADVVRSARVEVGSGSLLSRILSRAAP